ncbi:pre-rRNA processing protein [Cichlidogyrus casuarinus]|uniref:Pre-rRNA processing protein n=1 Tax=Cichlidogyrus casuarinus TaxID=1844966 RepID=A0ABD2QML3_9PLAT
MTPYLSKDSILELMKRIGPLLDSPSPMLCKRAYKILEEICAARTDQSRQYVEENFREMIQLLSSENCLISNLAQLNMSGKKKEQAEINSIKLPKIPWKSRLRILRYLLRDLVLDIQKMATEESELENHQHVLGFIDLFLDETLLAFRKHGAIVQNEAANLLCDYVFALSGVLSPREHAKQRELLLESKSMETGMDDEQEDDDASVSSLNTNLPINSALKVTEQYRICRSLLDFLPRLMSRLPPANAQVLTPKKTKTKVLDSHWERLVVTAGHGLTRLLNHMHMKSMLLLILAEPQTEENAELKQRIIGILADLVCISESCVKINKKCVAEQGLQIVKSLVAYAGRWIYVSELTSSIVKVNPLIKSSMRNTVRKIMEKLVKKVGVTSLQPLVSIEYHKMINNINKEMLRTDRKKSGKDAGRSAEEMDEESQYDDAASKRSKASIMSEMSHISLPKRVHMPRMDELLSAGQEKLHESDKRSMKSNLTNKSSANFAPVHKSLVEDIEMARAEDGLSRKSKQQMRLGLKAEERMNLLDEDENMSDDFDDEDEENEPRRPLQKAGGKRSS